MAALAETVNRDLEVAITQILRGTDEPMSLDELVHVLSGRGFHDLSEIRGAMWRLISDVQIELTSDRRLKIAS